MLLSLVLYGSRARGDHRHASDVDLLGIVEGGPIRRQTAERGVNLHLYPLGSLIKKAQQGDLFVLHLVTEGRVLHDTALAFAQAKEAFAYREGYRHEVRNATAVVRYLLSNREALEKKRARARLIWGIRTMLVASAAERREPVFSSASLEKFAGLVGLKNVIDKKCTVALALLGDTAEAVLGSFGDQGLLAEWPKDERVQAEILESLSAIARDTTEMVQGRVSASKLEDALGGAVDDYASSGMFPGQDCGAGEDQVSAST